MKILKYLILILIFFNVPTFGLMAFGTISGGIFSVLLFGCIFVYFFINEKGNPVFPFVILGLLYFLISGIHFTGLLQDFFTDLIKYLILVLFTTQLLKKSTNNELCFLLLLGTLSILLNVLIFPNDYGRYSGFYVNPNRAGFVCLLGFALTYRIKTTSYRLIAQFLFTISGILTFSRSFILLLILINLLSIISNKRNIIALITGFMAMIIILNSSTLQLNTDRFDAFKSVFSDEVDTETISKNSRDETWAEYTNVLFEKPVFGHGYKSTQGAYNDTLGIKVGVHNSYLMILGESGIIPFLLFIIIYVALFIRSFRHFKTHPVYTYLSIILLSFLLVSHNFFEDYIGIFISIWLYLKVKETPETNSIIETI